MQSVVTDFGIFISGSSEQELERPFNGRAIRAKRYHRLTRSSKFGQIQHLQISTFEERLEGRGRGQSPRQILPQKCQRGNRGHLGRIVQNLQRFVSKVYYAKALPSTVDVVWTWIYGGAYILIISMVKGLIFCWCNV